MKPKQIKIISPTAKQQEGFCSRCNEIYTALLERNSKGFFLSYQRKTKLIWLS